jgi:3-carboxy-cis,cis-muconate cycloisomerase
VKLITEGLQVYPENMMRNLKISKGMINAENVMMALGNSIGKQKAHEIIVDETRKAMREDKTLEEVLLANDVVRKHIKPAEVRKLCDPFSYTGLSSVIVDEVVQKFKKK